jgi:glutathione synthase/RimK-type ligase-like ATP-grasp enzyme
LNRILLVTATSDLAADLIILNLERRGLPFTRVNQEDFPQRISITWPGKGKGAMIAVDDEMISCCDEISSAWFRSAAFPQPVLRDDRRTAEFVSQECAGFLAGFWETMPWFWINRPSALARASSKLWQLALADAHGFRVPRTLVTNCARTARDFVRGGESIAKAVVSSGFREAGRRYAIFTTPITSEDLSDEAVRSAPVIYQERIANRFDLRVTVVGERVFASRISSSNAASPETDWRAVDPAHIVYDIFPLPSALEAACVKYVRAHSLIFAALDFIITPEGDYVFLEINPSGQWGWLEEATGAPITDAIVDCLIKGDA